MWKLALYYHSIWAIIYALSNLVFYLINILTGNRITALKTSENRKKYASHILSAVHALGTLYWSSTILMNDYHESKYLDDRYFSINTEEKNRFLLFGLSYFTSHTLYLLTNHEYTVFLIHHFLVSSGLLLVLYLEQAATVMVISYLMGEITNPLQLTWQTSKELGYLDFYKKISPFFTVTFIAVRCIIVPYISYYLDLAIWYKTNLNTIFKVILITLGIGMNIAGFVWSCWLVTGYLKFRNKTSVIQTDVNVKEKNT